jgi:hypothetical protein
MRIKFKSERKKRILKIFAGLVYICIKIATANPELVEIYYSNGLYPLIAKVFSSVSKVFPFSLWDIFWLLLIMIIIAGLILTALKKIRFWRFWLRLGQVFSLLYVFFYFSWGFNYFRPKIENRIDLEVKNVNMTLFRSVLDSMITLTNKHFFTITDSEYIEIDNSVELSYSRNNSLFSLNYPNGSRRSKRMIFSNFMAKSGISGYFGPFFNEVNLNSCILPIDYPFLLAHEKAHQFGISNEAEANFVAYIICTTSDDRRLQYSGYMSVLLYFLSDAKHLKDYRDYIKKIEDPVIIDLRYRQKYYEGLKRKSLDKAQTFLNNAYLKSNNIKEGVENYNQVVEMVIGWYQKPLK